jgi:hypothetical protein
MDERDRELLAGSVRALLSGPDLDVVGALDELGWDEVLADDPAGATTLLFTEHGRALATSAVLDRVLLAELGLDGPSALLYPPFGAGWVAAEGVLLAAPDPAGELVVPVRDGVALVAAAGTDARPVTGFDPDAGWWLARLPDSPAPHAAIGPERWASALAAGRRALAAELNGVTEVLLEITVRHTSERVQYGRAIAGYQTVRHRLAEGHVLLEASRSLLDAAWDGAAEPTAPATAWAAAAAKAQAGQAYGEVARHAMQLCGAIGLTQEHRLHGYVQRGALLDGLLGSTRELTRELGARLLGGFRPPAVVDL